MILGVVQARTSSSRLQGKVLKPILGRPMLERQLERVARARLIDKIVVATSDDTSADALAALCASLGVACYRGSLSDVLARMHAAAAAFAATHVVRLTGDCPLTEPSVIDAVIAQHLAVDADYTSNVHPCTYPDGLDVEVIRFAALEAAHDRAVRPSEREHVTLYIYTHPLEFRLSSIQNARDLSQMRWTVDDAPDLALVQRVYEALYPSNPNFGMEDVVRFLEANPEVRALNATTNRNEGLAKSMAAETRTEN